MLKLPSYKEKRMKLLKLKGNERLLLKSSDKTKKTPQEKRRRKLRKLIESGSRRA
jgi:hypothetical protein